MSVLGILLGLVVVVAVYIWVRRMDKNYYARRQEVIEQRLERIKERANEQEQENSEDEP